MYDYGFQNKDDYTLESYSSGLIYDKTIKNLYNELNSLGLSKITSQRCSNFICFEKTKRILIVHPFDGNKVKILYLYDYKKDTKIKLKTLDENDSFHFVSKSEDENYFFIQTQKKFYLFRTVDLEYIELNFPFKTAKFHPLSNNYFMTLENNNNRSNLRLCYFEFESKFISEDKIEEIDKVIVDFEFHILDTNFSTITELSCFNLYLMDITGEIAALGPIIPYRFYLPKLVFKQYYEVVEFCENKTEKIKLDKFLFTLKSKEVKCEDPYYIYFDLTKVNLNDFPLSKYQQFDTVNPTRNKYFKFCLTKTSPISFLRQSVKSIDLVYSKNDFNCFLNGKQIRKFNVIEEIKFSKEISFWQMSKFSRSSFIVSTSDNRFDNLPRNKNFFYDLMIENNEINCQLLFSYESNLIDSVEEEYSIGIAKISDSTYLNFFNVVKKIYVKEKDRDGEKIVEKLEIEKELFIEEINSNKTNMKKFQHVEDYFVKEINNAKKNINEIDVNLFIKFPQEKSLHLASFFNYNDFLTKPNEIFFLITEESERIFSVYKDVIESVYFNFKLIIDNIQRNKKFIFDCFQKFQQRLMNEKQKHKEISQLLKLSKEKEEKITKKIDTLDEKLKDLIYSQSVISFNSTSKENLVNLYEKIKKMKVNLNKLTEVKKEKDNCMKTKIDSIKGLLSLHSEKAVKLEYLSKIHDQIQSINKNLTESSLELNKTKKLIS